jgi:hypothetical protein
MKMQQYFIHCYWHTDSRCTHVEYLGECSQAEARAKFDDAVEQEWEKFDVITLDDMRGSEVCRHSRA